MDNDLTLLELRLELAALQKTRTRTPEEARNKTNRVLFIGSLIDLMLQQEAEGGTP